MRHSLLVGLALALLAGLSCGGQEPRATAPGAPPLQLATATPTVPDAVPTLDSRM